MKIINGNVLRALQRIVLNPKDSEHLVEESCEKELMEFIKTRKKEDIREPFDLKTEFNTQYGFITTAMETMGKIDTKEDLDILKEAQKFLSFILRNEEKLNDIQAVKDFKEAVLRVLDEESPELRDRVIRKLHE